MAKKKYKSILKEIDADQFLSSLPEPQWPIGVIENIESSTGYSFGTLEITNVNGVLQRDGFEIHNTDYVLFFDNDVASRMIESVFLRNFVEV